MGFNGLSIAIGTELLNSVEDRKFAIFVRILPKIL